MPCIAAVISENNVSIPPPLSLSLSLSLSRSAGFGYVDIHNASLLASQAVYTIATPTQPASSVDSKIVLSSPSGGASAKHTVGLALKPLTLPAGLPYRFRLTATNSYGEGFAEIAIATNSESTSGQLDVVLPTGVATAVAMDTIVTLRASGWVDEPDNLPLKFRFGVQTAVGVVTWLNAPQQYDDIVTVLPAGNPLSLVLEVYNSHGSSVRRYRDVVILTGPPASASSLLSVVQAAGRLITDNRETVSSLSQVQAALFAASDASISSNLLRDSALSAVRLAHARLPRIKPFLTFLNEITLRALSVSSSSISADLQQYFLNELTNLAAAVISPSWLSSRPSPKALRNNFGWASYRYLSTEEATDILDVFSRLFGSLQTLSPNFRASLLVFLTKLGVAVQRGMVHSRQPATISASNIVTRVSIGTPPTATYNIGCAINQPSCALSSHAATVRFPVETANAYRVGSCSASTESCSGTALLTSQLRSPLLFGIHNNPYVSPPRSDLVIVSFLRDDTETIHDEQKTQEAMVVSLFSSSAATSANVVVRCMRWLEFESDWSTEGCTTVNVVSFHNYNPSQLSMRLHQIYYTNGEKNAWQNAFLLGNWIIPGFGSCLTDVLQLAIKPFFFFLEVVDLTERQRPVIFLAGWCR